MATKKKKAPSKNASKTPSKKASPKKAPSKKASTKKAPSKKASTKKKAASKKASTSTKKASPEKSLYQRMGVKTHTLHVVDPPVGFEITVPMGCGFGFEFPARVGDDDAILAFVNDVAAVNALAKKTKKALVKRSDPLLWVAFPKRGQGAPLTRDRGWDALTALGCETVAIVAVDDTWSALRFRVRG